MKYFLRFQLSNEVASLGERLASREAELAEIKQLKAVPAQNGLTAENEQQKVTYLFLICYFCVLVRSTKG